MSTPFAPRASGGDFFKPAERVGDLAIIFEFKKIMRDQPHTYEGVASTRDVAYADVACFRTSEDVENKTPSLIVENVSITNQVLVADVDRNDWLGKATVQVIRKVGRAYVYRDGEEISTAAMDAAIAYYEAREASVAAVEVPDFE